MESELYWSKLSYKSKNSQTSSLKRTLIAIFPIKNDSWLVNITIKTIFIVSYTTKFLLGQFEKICKRID